MGSLKSPQRALSIHLAIAVALVGGATLGPTGASAQNTLVIGGTGQPSVEVNIQAIQNYGYLPAQRQLLTPGTPRDGAPPIQLIPPGGMAAPAQVMLAPPPPPAPAAPAPTPAPTVIASPPPPPPEPASPPPMPEPAVAETTTIMPAPEPAPAPPPEPEPVAAPEPPPAPEPAAVVAALPTAVPAGGMAPGEEMRLLFDGDVTDLSGDASSQLGGLAAQLTADESLRVQVKAYASGSGGSASTARRISLSRALAVRAHLIGEGVRSTRIDVRALGNKSEDGPTERVDVVLVAR